MIVTIDGPQGEATQTTTTLVTDAEGCAVFQNIDVGDYEVSVDKAGHVDIFQRTAPDVVETLPALEQAGRPYSSYGQRLAALLRPEVTGDYVFAIAADDAATLVLSSDEDPTTAARAAPVVGSTAAARAPSRAAW